MRCSYFNWTDLVSQASPSQIVPVRLQSFIPVTLHREILTNLRPQWCRSSSQAAGTQTGPLGSLIRSQICIKTSCVGSWWWLFYAIKTHRKGENTRVWGDPVQCPWCPPISSRGPVSRDRAQGWWLFVSPRDGISWLQIDWKFAWNVATL